MNIFEAVKKEVDIINLYQDLSGNTISNYNNNVNCIIPGHSDKTPSMKLYPTTNTFHCFGCGAGGSVIDLVAEVHGIASPLEAAKWLADRYNINYDDLSPEAKEKIKKKQSRMEILKRFIEKSHKRLNQNHRQLLYDRGLSDKTIDKYKIGYCPEIRPGQLNELKNNKPEKYKEYKKIGLISDNNYFIPGGRIIIPFWKYKKPVYWTGWDKNKKDYKYLNPAGLNKPVIFHRASNETNIYITEGVFDFYSFVEAGKNVIAVLGAKTKDSFLKRIERMKDKKIYIAFDNDSNKNGENPGQEAAEAMARKLWPDIQAEILNLPQDKDINDLLKEDSNCNIEKFKNKVETLTSDLIIERTLQFQDPINFTNYNIEQLDPDILPEWLKDFAVNVSEFTQSPVDMSIMLIIAALGTALANKAVIQIKKGYTEPLNIWTCTVLPAANRKSPVFKRVMKPILQYEELKREEKEPEKRHALKEKSILENRLKKKEKEASNIDDPQKRKYKIQEVTKLDDEIEDLQVPALPRLVASDVTAERLAQLMEENSGRIAVLSPEGDIFKLMAGRYSKSGSTNFENYKKGWTGGEPIRDDRMGRKGTHVRNPALTQGLTVQPVVLEDLTDKKAFRGEGILGRFLYTIPESPVGKRKTGPEVPELSEVATMRYKKGLQVLLHLKPAAEDETGEYKPHIINLSPEALKIRDEFEAEVEEMLGEGGDLQNIPDWGGKLVGNITRVAGLLHIAGQVDAQKGCMAQRFGESTVSSEAMKNAVKLGRQLIQHALKVFDLLDTDPELELAKYVLKRIKKGKDLETEGELPKDKSKLDKSVLMELCRGKKEIKTPEDLEEPLHFLERLNFIKILEIKSTGRGRNPSPLIKINPKVYQINQINKIKKDFKAKNDNKSVKSDISDTNTEIKKENELQNQNELTGDLSEVTF